MRTGTMPRHSPAQAPGAPRGAAGATVRPVAGLAPARRSILVVSYSRTGHTRYLAQQIAEQCGADQEEIVDRVGRRGLLGYLRSLVEAVLRLSAPIAPSKRAPRDYELVIVGTPVWAWHLSSPVRAYLRRHRGEARRMAFFCTYGGSGQARVLDEMAKLCGRPPLATLALTTRDVAMRQHWRPVARFVRTLRSVRRAGLSSLERQAA